MEMALISEVAFTTILCLVVLSVAVEKKTKSPVLFGLAIGSCVTVGGNATGAISGGSLNPAVSFGIAAPSLSLMNAVFYALAEFVGAAAAAGVVMVTHASADDKAKAEP